MLAKPRSASGRGVVVMFTPQASADNRLGIQDRITLLEWAHGPARGAGIARVRVEQPDGAGLGEEGDFAMMYREASPWAAWCVARSGGRYQLWETAFGRTLGVHVTLAQALAHLETESAHVNGFSTLGTQVAASGSEQADAAPNGSETTTQRRAAG